MMIDEFCYLANIYLFTTSLTQIIILSLLINVIKICMKIIRKAQLHCPDISRTADDWAVVSVSVRYMVRVPLKMLARPG